MSVNIMNSQKLAKENHTSSYTKAAHFSHQHYIHNSSETYSAV